MRNKRWLRAGLASLTVCGLALSAFVVACGDDDTGGAGVTPGTDAGNKTDTGPNTNPDSGGTDSGGGDKDAGPPAAKLQLINAATDLGPGDNGVGALRICYKVGTDDGHLVWATLPPLPNRIVTGSAQPFPGLFAGTGGPVDGTGVSLEALVVKPYLISAFSLEKHGFGKSITPDTEKDCQSILEGDAGGAGAFVENTDFWVLPAVPAGSFKNGDSYLLALTGCAGGSLAGASKCGGDPGATPGVGNLKINVFKVDNTTTVDSDKLGVQFVSLSPNLEGFLQTQGGGTLHTRPSIQSDKGNSATGKLIAATTDNGDAGGDVAPGKFTTLLQVSGVNNGADFLMANPNVPQIAYTLPQTAALSFGVADGGAYANGHAFTVVALGDIAGDPDGGNGGATFNTKFFHFLALPNDPAVKNFDPSK